MLTPTVSPPTPGQRASAALHLERRPDWRFYRVDGVRYVALPSANSGKTYQVRADAAACSCVFYQRTGRACAHMIAVRQARPAAAPTPRPSYADLFPACRDCGDIADGLDGKYCGKCHSDREWQARREARAV